MQTERQMSANPQTMPTDLTCESASRLLSSASTSPFISITQPKSWYSFYHPMEGGRLSWPRNCSKDVQPMPKAVYHSDCRDKLWTAHSEIRTWVPLHRIQHVPPHHCYLQRHMGVNNLPKVVTRHCCGCKLNSQPSSCESNTLTTRLPSHPLNTTIPCNTSTARVNKGPHSFTCHTCVFPVPLRVAGWVGLIQLCLQKWALGAQL